MHALTAAFIAAALSGLLVRIWLNVRQSGHVSAHSDQVPEAFRDSVSPEDHRRAAAYSCARLRVGRVALVWSVLLALIWTLGGGLTWLDGLVRGLDQGPVITGTVFLVALLILSQLLELPLEIWRDFGVEARFGFNRSTPTLFAVDQLKGLALTVLLAAPIAAAVIWLMLGAGDAWWIWAWALWSGFSFLMLWAWPRLIAPMFNRFQPLEGGELLDAVEETVRRCGFESQGVMVMDASRRSSHGNAYFTGMGRNKRIVFFDTLLDGLSVGQVTAVLAHELGHYHHHHVTRRLLVSLIMSGIGFALLGYAASEPELYAALGVADASPHAAIALFLIVLPHLTWPLGPIGARWSRAHEYQADRFAMEHADPRDLADALVKLYRDNASTLTPDPLHSAFHDSHPPPTDRIRALIGSDA